MSRLARRKSKSNVSRDGSGSSIATDITSPRSNKATLAIRNDGFGYAPQHEDSRRIESLNYIVDESEAWRAHQAHEHYRHRGKFWNAGKHEIVVRYVSLALIGICQGSVAFFTNYGARTLGEMKFDSVAEIVQSGVEAGKSKMFYGFLVYYAWQLGLVALASSAVMFEPMCGGSGIPEVKVFLNGIDLPNILPISTGVAKVLGVIGSVAGGLPVGKEGPMVHSGAVVASAVTSRQVRDDKARRDYVACGSASGVCTAFSAPIGGVLFALEEGASFWSPNVTFRAFFCSAWSIATLYILGTISDDFGKFGLDKLFSFGNFTFQGRESSYAMFELFYFVVIGVMGGLIGAVFNGTNEKITHWRMKHVNHTPRYRYFEALCVSTAVSIVGYGLPFLWTKCTPLPDTTNLDAQQIELIGDLVPFGCIKGEEYNELASLFMNDGNDAIKLLFHMHEHTFSMWALFLFFSFYISLATITYGIAVPSGLFVPSLLSGAAFGRLFGNLAYKVSPERFAFSSVYSLIGAAAVLGGMARMTISLTVILLEATGNEQFVLPLMITLFTARVVGQLFNDDLYHMHIHMKPGVHFLDHHLRDITGNHHLLAADVMSGDVVFIRPIENVGVIYDLLCTCQHAVFPVVDTNDKDVLFGTIPRHALCMLLQKKGYGLPVSQSIPLNETGVQNHVTLDPFDTHYVPLLQWKELEKEYPRYVNIKDVPIPHNDRDLLMDLRPYANTAPYTIRENASAQKTYEMFRTLGLRMLPVVNKYNQCVGTISRKDLTSESLAQDMLTKGKTA